MFSLHFGVTAAVLCFSLFCRIEGLYNCVGWMRDDLVFSERKEAAVNDEIACRSSDHAAPPSEIVQPSSLIKLVRAASAVPPEVNWLLPKLTVSPLVTVCAAHAMRTAS